MQNRPLVSKIQNRPLQSKIQNQPLVSKIQIGHERPKSKIGYDTKARRDDSGSYISTATSSSLFDVEATK